MLKKLQPHHKKFVNLCLETGSNTEAYLEAFPSTKDRHTAAVNANRLLKDPLVQEYYKKLEAELEEKGIATTEEIMRTYTDVLRRKIPDYSISKDGEIYKHPAKLSDVLRAGEALLRRLDKAAEKKTQNEDGKKYGVIIMPAAESETEGGE